MGYSPVPGLYPTVCLFIDYLVPKFLATFLPRLCPPRPRSPARNPSRESTRENFSRAACRSPRREHVAPEVATDVSRKPGLRPDATRRASVAPTQGSGTRSSVRARAPPAGPAPGAEESARAFRARIGHFARKSSFFSAHLSSAAVVAYCRSSNSVERNAGSARGAPRAVRDGPIP